MLQVRRAPEGVSGPPEALALLDVPQVLGALESNDSSEIAESSFEATASLQRIEFLATLSVDATTRALLEAALRGSVCASDRMGAGAKLTSRASRGRWWAQAPDASGIHVISASPARENRRRNATCTPLTALS
jgi:hypothetical protein